MTKQRGEVPFGYLSSMEGLKLINNLFPGLFHPCKAYHIKTLEGMGTVRQVPKDYDILILGILQ